MAPADAIKNFPGKPNMTDAQGQTTGYEIRSEAHGPHWVAWAARGADGKPEQSVLLVGETREEAETRARAWAEQNLR